MFDVLRELHRKVDELIGRSERTLSLLGQHQGLVQVLVQVIELGLVKAPRYMV